jgi:hypothetical protein
MPRQTNEKNIQFPDGFQFAIADSDGDYMDVGVIAGGATASLTWDDYYLDAGNYEALIDKIKNPVMALAPSAVWNWDTAVIAALFPGVFATADASGTPAAGDNVTYAGTSNQVTLTRVSVRLAHFPEVMAAHTLIADDITAIADGTNNQLVTVPKSTFTDALTWTSGVDLFTSIDSMDEVSYADRDLAANQGDYCTDSTNLYFIVDLATYADLAAAKTGLTGTVVSFYDDIDWIFTLYNAKVEAGASFNFKGVNEDGLDEFTVSFQGKPDPANSYRLFKLFKAS